MSTQTLKDKHFNIVGYIETESDGRQVGKDRHFNIVGYYTPRDDRTTDRHFSKVGEGNLLAALIWEA